MAFSKFLLWFLLIANVVAILIAIWAIRKLGGWDATMYRLSHKGLSGIYENRKTLFEMLETEKTDIIWLGDSLTEKGEWSELFKSKRHKNRGISGDYCIGVLNRLPTITQGKPTALFLMIGTNELLMGYTPKDVIIQYRKIVEQILQKSPNTQLFLESVLPINNKNWVLPKANKKILELNQFIQALAKEKEIDYLDLHKELVNEDGRLDKKYTYDGIHLNGDAYRVWKETLDPIVAEL